jgi:hypothetical protein
MQVGPLWSGIGKEVRRRRSQVVFLEKASPVAPKTETRADQERELVECRATIPSATMTGSLGDGNTSHCGYRVPPVSVRGLRAGAIREARARRAAVFGLGHQGVGRSDSLACLTLSNERVGRAEGSMADGSAIESLFSTSK